MPVVLGIDLGTTSITSLALDADTGDVLTRCTHPNRANITSLGDSALGRSEWDAFEIEQTAHRCLFETTELLGNRRGDVVGIGITGQQHGVVLQDPVLPSRTILINWQDRRGDEPHPGSQVSYVEQAARLLGDDVRRRTGCRLATGYLVVTLFWLNEKGLLPRNARACFLPDHFAAGLTGQPVVTDASCAASGGVFNLTTGDWDEDGLAALGLRRQLLPPVRASGEVLGPLRSVVAETAGLPANVSVCVGIGDNQASFLGSVASRRDSVLVNVGTGGQVSAWTDRLIVDPKLETRPFPGSGYLLVCAGLCGGRSYALLERFFREVGSRVLGRPADSSVYETMNRLAAEVPRGAGGLRCEPFFTGTRAEPTLRASWTGISAENFTPAHMTRALLEGMAQAFRGGHEAILAKLDQPRTRLVGAGNGLRENPLLGELVAAEFGLPLTMPCHREEAAFGAALMASVGLGLFPDLDSAGRLIRS